MSARPISTLPWENNATLPSTAIAVSASFLRGIEYSTHPSPPRHEAKGRIASWHPPLLTLVGVVSGVEVVPPGGGGEGGGGGGGGGGSGGEDGDGGGDGAV